MRALICTACLVAVICCFAHTTSGDTSVYEYGTRTCLQGTNGPGMALILRQTQSCEVSRPVPYIEIDIREYPIRAGRDMIIGPENWAFRCPDPKDPCTQFLSGKIRFDHFEQPAGKGIPLTDGHFELRSTTGTEAGYFKVICFAACA